MNIPKNLMASAKTILDVGGWAKPEPRATHVVDRLPWETRGVRLNLKQLPGEFFSKETWHQADFLASDFTLPFADKYFDLVICGQTVEDLADPSKLLSEMRRVGKAGFIESPSRISEQTAGIRDRERKQTGHPHHQWIVDVENGGLVLYSKEDSRLDSPASVVPLMFYEQIVATRGDSFSKLSFSWHNEFSFRCVRGEECARRAKEAVASLHISPLLRVKDSLLRFARRARSRIRGRASEDFTWWRDIVEQSRPYSTMELP
jgi:SAM-dependent methyltransferase